MVGVTGEHRKVESQKVNESSYVVERPVTQKISARNMPSYSLTGDMKVSSNSEGNQANADFSIGVLSEEDIDKVKSNWVAVQKYLEDSGKIRLLAALSHSRFEAGKIVVTVANKAIEQEVLDARADIQEFIYQLVKVRVIFVTEVTENEVFIAKPVSDSQRLHAIIEKHPEIKLLCEKLKLTL